MVQLNFDTVRRQSALGFLGPFHGHHPSAVKIVGPPQLVKLFGIIDAVQIDMSQRETSTVFMDKHKGGARHILCGCAETLGQSFDELCFTRSEIALECHDLSAPKKLSQPGAEPSGRCCGAENPNCRTTERPYLRGVP